MTSGLGLAGAGLAQRTLDILFGVSGHYPHPDAQRPVSASGGEDITYMGVEYGPMPGGIHCWR